MSYDRVLAAVIAALALFYLGGCVWAARATQGASLVFAALVSLPLFYAARELWGDRHTF